jgi:DNA-binding MarR family transcriptional regulator
MTDAPETRTEPRWLDDEERDAWLQIAGLIIRLPAALETQLQRDAAMSHFEYAVLARLSEAPRRTLRMSTLAAFANGSLSRLSHVVKRLENRGWVYREPCRDDGRSTNATLTDAGYAALAEAAPAHVEIVRRLVIDALSRTELRQMGAAARRVLEAVDEDSARR